MNKYLSLFCVALFACHAHASRLVPIGYQAMDYNGKPYSGAKLYAYETACAVAQDTWSVEASVGTANNKNTNPVVANASGRFGEVFGDADAYCLVLKTSAGVTIWSKDLVYGDSTAYPYTTLAVTNNTATATITGTNSNAGHSVYGKNTGTGYGVYAEADATSPVRAALHLVPQDTTPSTPLKGDVWANSVTGKLSTHDGTTEQRSINQAHAITVSETRAFGVGWTSFTTSQATFGANTLRVGQTIRARAVIDITAVTDGAGTGGIYWAFSSASGFSIAPAALTNAAYVILTVEYTITALGAVGSFVAWATLDDPAGLIARQVLYLPGNINTTAANNLYVTWGGSGAGLAFTGDMVQFIVDISS